ncbi:MAG: hypothetical protein ACM3ZB_10620 [bacterium]|jgi:hypothetical protein
MPSDEKEKNKNPMRDRVDRPEPRSDITEGDEDTIDESLRQHEKQEGEPKKRTA